MKIFKDTLHASFGVAAKVVGSLTLNKFFAVYFGAAGVTLLAHFQNLIGLLTQVPMDGINRGIMRYWAMPSHSDKLKTELFFTGVIINLIIFALAVVSIFIIMPQLNDVLAQEIHGALFYWVLFSALFVFVLNLMLQSLVLAAQRFKDYSLLQLSNVSIMLLAVMISFIRHDIGFSFLVYSIALAAGIIPTTLYLFRYPVMSFQGFSISAEASKKLSAFVMMALSVLIFGKLLDFLVRDYAINSFGLEATGLWQSVVKVSDMYMMLFVSVIGTVYYPSVSSLILDPDQLRAYVRDMLKMLLPIISIGLAVLYLTKDFILGILYTHEFVNASVFFPYQLVGDFFGMISFLLAYIISAQARTLTYIGIQLFSAVVYLIFMAVFLVDWGIMSLPLAHMCRHILFFLLLLVLNRRMLSS